MSETARLAAVLNDRYRIERELGTGGMATVYLAVDLKHQREVALKVLRPELAAVLGAERFLHEIRITARLDHPHILTLIDSGDAGGRLYYVLPLVRGESLRQRLQREKQLGLEDALAITKQIAGALDYAHRQGVVHRDIKPGNILLHEGEAMLADFGIALAVKEAGGNRLTETGLSLGTPQYMSPEQATGDRDLDARSDVYSLGAVLYEMLVGEPPVTGPSAQAMIAKLMTERPTRVRVLRDTVPEGVDNAVAKALAKVPADRFRSAGEFATALSAPTITQASAGRRRQRWWLGIGLAATVVAGAAAIVLLRPSAPAPPVTSQLTSTGAAYMPSLSPDGRLLSYVIEKCVDRPRRCRQSVLVQDLGSGSRPTAVAEDFLGAGQARWSSDGTRLYFLGIRDTANAIFTVPRFGGTVERIGPYFALSIHPDGRTALATAMEPAGRGGRVLRLRADTWDVLDTIRIPDEVMTFEVAWAPNGRWALVMGNTGLTFRLLLLDAGGRIVDQTDEPRLGYRAFPRARWTPQSDGFYFLAEVPGSRADLLRRGVDPRRGRFVGGGDTVLARLQVPSWGAFDVSSDGRLLAYTHGLTTNELWTVERGPGRSWTTRHRLTSTAGLTHADLSEDGQVIAFGAVEESGDSVWQRLYVLPFAGGEPRPVGPRLTGVTGPWLPQGLADTLFVQFRGDRDSVAAALVPARGGPMRSVPGDVRKIVGLPDGRRLWFRRRPDGRTAIEWHGIQGSLERRVSPDSLGSVDLSSPSADGRAIALLFVTMRDGRPTARLYRLDAASGELSPLLHDDVSPTGFLKWLSDGRLAMDTVSSWAGGAENLRLRFYLSRGGRPDVEELPLPFAIGQFAATHDLRRGVGIVERRNADVFLIRNFDPRTRR